MSPTPDAQRHVFSVLVENKPGVLARVAGLFSARGFNIESLSVGETETSDRSRITLTVKGPPDILEQVRKQLEKLIDTVKVANLSLEDRLERGLALFKIRVPPPLQNDVLHLAGIFGARVLDCRDATLILELAGTEDEIDRFTAALLDMPPAAGPTLARRVENAVHHEVTRLARALGEALGKEVPLPERPDKDAARAKAPAIELLEVARAGRVAMKLSNAP